jgi:hypothetical protein
MSLFGFPLTIGELVAVAAVGLGTMGFALYLGRRLFIRGEVVPLLTRPDVSLQSAIPGLGVERRTSARRKGSSVAAHLSDDGDSTPAEVWVMDRSLGGLCLLAEAPVAVGSRLRVRPLHASGDQIWSPIRVCACRRDGEGWLIHCQFLQIPPMNVLLLFG